MRTVEVPAMQIYTKDEWYAQCVAKLADPQSADQHMLLAEDLIKVRDYDHAGEHLELAGQLGNSRDPARLDSLRTKLARYKDAAMERELLDQISACRSRRTLGEFEKGQKLIAQFLAEFPASKIKDEFEAEKERFARQRQAYYSQQLADYLRRSIQSVANKKVGEPGFSLQAARDYAENQMSDDLFARAAEQFRVEVDEAKQLWADRVNYIQGKRTEHFAYGIGSWVLTEPKILAGTERLAQQEKQKQSSPDDARENKVLERIMRQAMERRRAAAQQGGAGDEEQTDEGWWNEATRADRTNWLRAYFAESGGQLVVTYASVSACVSCLGRGTLPDLGPDGKVIQKKCFLCHDTKWVRSFKAY
jgi:hypothetical protein